MNSRVARQLIVSTKSFLTAPFVRPREGALDRYFARVYAGEEDDLLFDGSDPAYLDQVSFVIDMPELEDADILDVGCGPARLYGYLLKHQVRFGSYVGIDLAHENSMLHHNARIDRVDVRDAPIAQSPLAAFAINSLCYLDDGRARGLFEVIAKESTLVVVDPVPGIFWDKHFEGVRPHYRRPERVVRLLGDAGWMPERICIQYAMSFANNFVWPLSYAIGATKL